MLSQVVINGDGYKPLIRVRGSRPYQVRPHSKELKSEDTCKKREDDRIKNVSEKRTENILNYDFQRGDIIPCIVGI